MADTFQLEIATPERLLLDEQVAQAELPGKNGYFGVLPGHAPLLSALGAGVLSFNQGGRQEFLAIDGGFAEVLGDHVRVLAEHAEYGRDVQVDRARRQLEEASTRLRDLHEDALQSEAALSDVQKAQARIDAAERAGGAHY
jgi:F-type H+-transporting ATPase subunit epsilon